MTELTEDGSAARTEAAGPRRLPLWLLPSGLALLIAALVAGLLLGSRMAEAGAERVTDPVSLGFVRDMSTHHAQAVRMSEIAHRRSSDPELNYLAFDILSSQQGQIGIMTGWLELWQQPAFSSAPQMAWMGHEGAMPGMATDAEIAALDTMPVAQLEEQWLRMMIRHHRGAVPMADAAAVKASSPEAAGFARKMSQGQQSEIDLMQSMLAARGFSGEPNTPEVSHGAGRNAEPAPAASSPSHNGH